MPPLYKIADWQIFFETNETRKLAVLRWLPKPNKHDGLGFGKMRGERDKVQLFCAWCLILDVASKTTPRDRRGYLERNGQPLDASDIAYLTGFPAEIFTRALDFFAKSSVGWLEVDKTLTGDTSAAAPGEPPRHLGQPPAVGKGMEGNGREENEVAGAPPPAGDDHSAFILGWCQNFEKSHKVKYQFDGGKDGRAVRELLKMGILRIDLLEIAKKAWAWRGNIFLSGKSLTIHGFRHHFNEIQAGVANGTNRTTDKPNPRNAGTIAPTTDYGEAAKRKQDQQRRVLESEVAQDGLKPPSVENPG